MAITVFPDPVVPADVDYLVGTASTGLSAEIVVGTTPGGELGGTWAAPTVAATHAGSAHHTRSHDHSDASDDNTIAPVGITVSGTGKTALSFGDATTTTGLTIGADTNLYRLAANSLKTDDDFYVALAVIVDHADAGGKLYFGSAADTNLYRASASVLKTDDELQIAGNLYSQAGSAANQTLLADGIYFGSATDTRLYRVAANQLKTDDQFIAVDGITTKPVAGAVSDASFTVAPGSGTIAVDTTNSLLYVRVGATWKSVALA